MEKEFIPYEQALALKELGFDEPCFGIYSKYHGQMKYSFLKNAINSNFIRLGDKVNHLCTTPLYQQAFRWFREKYNLECYIKSLYEQRENKGFYFGIDDYTNGDLYSKPYYSYEEAELECLKKLIEIVKSKQE